MKGSSSSDLISNLDLGNNSGTLQLSSVTDGAAQTHCIVNTSFNKHFKVLKNFQCK